MVAKMAYDKGISTLDNSQFNYNGTKVAEITDEMVRGILDFTIEKRPCKTEDGLVIPRMNYLRRSDGGIVDMNSSVGEEFEVTAQPLESYEIARFIMAKMPNVRIETVATMYNGGTTFLTLTHGGSWLVKGDTSPHFANVVISNPLTRGKIHLVQSCVRVVCQNTLALACKSGTGYRISHTTNARAMMEQALEGMRHELEQAQTTRQMCEFLASRSISVENVKRLMDTLYPLPAVKAGENQAALTRVQTKRAEVLNQFESDSSFTDKTFYTFLSANTYLSEHPLHKQARTDSVQVAYENMTGGRADDKARMLEAVYAEAVGTDGNGGEVIEAEYKMIA